MMRVECPREQETLDALAARRLPGRTDEDPAQRRPATTCGAGLQPCHRHADADLLSHLSACDICRDLVVVAATIQDAGDEDVSNMPSAATVWWRAQLRAHREASRKATAPIRIAQAGALVVALVALAAFQSVMPSWTPSLPFDRDALTAWWPGLPSIPWPSIALPSVDDLPPLTLTSIRELSGWWWLAFALLLWVAAAPIAVYLAGIED